MQIYLRARAFIWLTTFLLFAGLASARADGQNFFEPGAAEGGLEAIVVAVGKPFDLLGVSITADELTVDLIPTDSPTDPQSWRVSHRGVIGSLGLDIAKRVGDGSSAGAPGSIRDRRFAMPKDVFAIVPKLAAAAIAKARLDNPAHVTEMELMRLPAIVGDASKTPIWQISVKAVDEFADFGANLQGEITSSDLRHTNRAARLDLFAGDDDFKDFLTRIAKETGKDWKFHKLEIEKQDMRLSMRLASSPNAKIQRFTADIEEIKTSAMDSALQLFPDESIGESFDLAEIDFSVIGAAKKAALDTLTIPKGAVKKITIDKPHRESRSAIEWTVEVEETGGPLFRMPGTPEPLKGSVTFDAKGAPLHVAYPVGDSRQTSLLEPVELKRAVAEIADQLGAHEPIVEMRVLPDYIRMRAAAPSAPQTLAYFEYRQGRVSRTNEPSAAMFGDGPNWRWDLALLTPDVIDRLPDLTQKSIAAHPKPNARLDDYNFSKALDFYPSNTEPLIEIATEVDKDVETETFDFAGQTPAVVSGDKRNGLYVGNQPVSGGSDDIQGCEYSDDWPNVVKACTHWLDTHPKDAPRDRAIEYYNRGNAYMKLKDWKGAIADYTKAMAVDPTYQRPFTNRAYVYLESGDAEHAIADATKAIGADKQKTFAFIVRGTAERNLGRWDAAIADFGVVINQTQGDAQSYFDRGLTRYSKGDLDGAIADFSESSKRDGAKTDALVYRGIAKRLKGDIDGAIADHSAALTADPRSAAAWFNRGMEYYLNGATPKALADLSQAAALAPAEPYPGLLLDVVMMKSGLQSQLKEQSAKFDMGKWPAPAIRLLLAQSTPEALAAAAEDGAASDKPRRLCEANFYAGVALARAGKGEAATAKWREALAGCPKPTPERSYAETELKAVKAGP